MLQRNAKALFLVISAILFSTAGLTEDVVPSTANEKPLVLKPYQVISMSPDVDITLFLAQDGKISAVVITNVRSGSPAARAGLKPRMEIVRYRTQAVSGLTTEEFSTLREKIVPNEQALVFEVTERPGRGSKMILRLPIPKGMQTAPLAKGNTQTATP